MATNTAMEEVVDSSSSNESAAHSSSSKTLISFYSNYILNRFRTFCPVSISSAYTSLSNITGIYGSSTQRCRKTCLPLPLPSRPEKSSATSNEANIIFAALEDIIGDALQNLHVIQKNLEFWQYRAEGSNAQRAYFMICERGPSPFINSTGQLLRDCLADGSGMQNLYCSASSHISERISVLASLRFFLATFLAEVYMAVERVGEDLIKDFRKVLPSLLVAINDLFLKLEASVGHFHANRQSGSTVDGTCSLTLIFAKLPEVNEDGSQWTDCETRDAINWIYENLQTLDSYLSVIVSRHRKPRKVTLNWMRYGCGVIGVSIFSLWLLRHSKLMGSPDLDKWVSEAKDSTISFWKDHVEQPIVAIRDEVFETYRKRQQQKEEHENMLLTADSLHRMLLAFSEQAVGKKLPENTPDQEMLGIVMGRYEKELMHPIQGLVGGELVSSLLIQVQKLKLDVEVAMLELDKILRANQINFAMLAALPAFLVSIILAVLVRAWFIQDKRAEGRGRVVRIQRRILLVEIERAIMKYQKFEDEGLESDAQYMYGMVLYYLNSLYCMLDRHATSTGEWICLKQDIIDLANPSLITASKLDIAKRVRDLYDCLLPSSTRQ